MRERGGVRGDRGEDCVVGRNLAGERGLAVRVGSVLRGVMDRGEFENGGC